ncbi:monooxygenase [Spongiactinospora gelatinilytica]|uniref:Monooxygenase n=2 Tax=Spongiactinospora gelatinilytica TaxID=2666298 RepID=A0A2W2G532_9ACTN|nr:monooxygenase [Spongiactinospora gelatinilytica]
MQLEMVSSIEPSADARGWPMSVPTTPVLVVGGSLSGLCTALFLSRHGVDVTLVERHPGTSIHPRTPGYNARTLELFRAAGVEDAVRAAGPWALDGTGLLWAESLTSPNHRWLQPPNARGAHADYSDVSPANDAILSQDVLEPVLREHAEALGADLRFGTELVAFANEPDGVTAVLADRATGARTEIEAGHLVAADGADSPIRHRLKIDRHGPGVLEYVAAIMVRADLGDTLRGKRFVIGQVRNPGFSGMVRVVGDRISLHVRYRPQEGDAADLFPAARCVELARAATGIPGLDVEVLDVTPWETTAAVADRFSDGRVFLVGDAAHVMPPAGAYGGNTGIHDAANLAWKLAYVSRGWAGPALLDTYDTERRPIAEITMNQAVATRTAWFGRANPAGTPEAELLDEVSLLFGYRYPRPGTGGPLVEDPRRPGGGPGSRVPHVWLEIDGERLSTVDLWARGMVLLAGSEGGDWVRAADAVARDRGLPLTGHVIGGDATDLEGRWPEMSSTSPEGAMLVRPDGFIAWRTADRAGPDARSVLAGVLARTLGAQ